MIESIKMNTPCEMIDVSPVNPLISKCVIKVCYVSDEPNRNGTVITKEVAKKIAASLPGSPIVGRYNKDKQDFESHNKILQIKDGEITLTTDTQAYGFVDLAAPVYFQKFNEGGIIRDYLMTEGYIWTGQYPEAKRIIDRGNNQSMEFDEDSFKGAWAKDNNQQYEFFIINEAIIKNLCILGEDVEPCFEGATITGMQDLKTRMFSLIDQMKEILSKGGTPMPTEEENKVLETEEQPVTEEEVAETEPVVEEEAAAELETQEEEAAPAEEAAVAEEEATVEEEAETEEAAEEEEAPAGIDEATYAAVVAERDELLALRTSLESQISELTAFKKAVERKQKQEMIDSFYMLSDNDKKDVLENIDTYSLDDIEAKLSIICVHNKVSFNNDETSPVESTTYNLSDSAEDEAVPAWIKSVLETEKNSKF